MKKAGKQNTTFNINSESIYLNTCSLKMSPLASSLINAKFHKNPMKIPTVSARQHIVQTTVRISSLNQLAAILPGEFNNAG